MTGPQHQYIGAPWLLLPRVPFVVAAGADNLLLETGDNFLLETGDLLLLEA